MNKTLFSTILGFLLVAALFGQVPVPEGDEFQVNVYTTGTQGQPAVAMAPEGHFVVAWSDYNYPPLFGSIRAQQFAANGDPVGDEFQVSTSTSESPVSPSVAMNRTGDFVVIWQGVGFAGSGLLGRRFASDGAAAGEEFVVTPDMFGGGTEPSVAIDGSGRFVVAWTVGYGGGNPSDGSGSSIQARRFDATGETLGDQTQVNTYTTGFQVRPSIAMDADGQFVVVWASPTSDGRNSVRSQRFHSDGSSIGGEFQINASTLYSQDYAAVSATPDGRFVVVWNKTSGEQRILGRQFDADGAPVGEEFRADLPNGNDSPPSSPAVSIDPAGHFVVAWESLGSDGPDDSSYSIQARRFLSSGLPTSNPFQVNTYSSDSQSQPAVASNDDGDFSVVWKSIGSAGTDTSDDSIQGQRFRALCNDGDTLCLNDSRFQVEIEWVDFMGKTGSGQVVDVQSDDSGLFWFFNEDNWEMLIKVLDGCTINDHYWVFAAATTNVEYTLRVRDTQTGEERSYFNPLGTSAPALTDTNAFATCEPKSPDLPGVSNPVVDAPSERDFQVVERDFQVVSCGDNDTLCLNDSRFEVKIEWGDFMGNTGQGQTVPFRSDDSGLFWFFNDDNWEMLIKVLDGCAINDHFWVFAAATTNVEYTLVVTDTQNGSTRTYTNPLGNAADALTDTEAFATCSE